MASIHYLGPAEIADTIADCLDVVHVCAERREAVIKNSIHPILMLMEAGRVASETGPEEAAVFEYFLHCLNAQLEMRAKERAFSSLLTKLNEFNKLH
jgi:hypothetical protein